eukprot:g25627.t1
MERAVDSFERSLFSNQEVAYDVFGETVIPEADQWVKKNFEEMRESLEPVVQNEQSRKYESWIDHGLWSPIRTQKHRMDAHLMTQGSSGS